MIHRPRRQDPVVEHAVEFTQTDSFLIGRIADFVADGLRVGEHVLAVTTSQHWTKVAERLDERGVAHGPAAQRGQLIVADAETVLDQITIDGVASPDRFGEVLGRLLAPPQRWRIFGEVVSLLVARGEIDAALRIEGMGQHLSNARGVPILCAYHGEAATRLTVADRAQIKARHDRSFSEGSGAQAGAFHAVQFYRDDATLCGIVAGFLAAGFADGDPAVVIATPEHLMTIERELRARSIDIDAIRQAGDLAWLDAQETLAKFMRDGRPHGGMFKAVAGRIIDSVCRGRSTCAVRAYGEMVNVLWKDGREAAAIRLETLWNELANTHEFKLLCGYSLGNFYKGAAIDSITAVHSHLVDNSDPATIN